MTPRNGARQKLEPFIKRTAQTCTAIRRNIEAIATLEQEFLRRRSFADRAADAIGGFSGTAAFVWLHILAFAAYLVINLGYVPAIRPFDPYPFLLLSVGVSLEAIFLSAFVLMKQNRMSERADQRAHLDLQINLLAEREMTYVLQMLQRISTRLGVRLDDEELEELAEEVSLEALATQLRERLKK
jgi:uncharacterized membrane protein